MGYQQVILTEPIQNLGAEADVVRVRRGFARNFLLPQAKALEVTPAAMRRLDSLKARRAEREARELTAAEELARRVQKLKLSFKLETGETGKSFGSVTAKDIMDRISAEIEDADIPRHALVLEHPIKTAGDFEFPFKLHPDVTAHLKVKVTVDEPAGEADEDEAEGDAPKKAKATRRTAKS